MEQPLFNSNDDLNGDITYVSNLIYELDSHKNEDMNVELKGKLHNSKGFILTVTNMCNLSQSQMAKWKEAIELKYRRCEMTCDFNEGWIDVKCYTKQDKKKPVLNCCSSNNFYVLLYISMFLISIYMLWQKHSIPQPQE